MNKIPLILFSTDWHLKKENLSQIKELVIEKCLLAKKLEVKNLICLGDIFDSRIAQREDVLTAFGEILDIIDSYGLNFWVIPGNHDKTIYTGAASFLTPYKGRHNFHLVDLAGGIPFLEHNLYVHMQPFFEEEVWLEQYGSFVGDYIGFAHETQADGKHIFCSHIAVTGSRNNDGTLVSSTISSGMFKNFFKVFSGHYHDQQQIGANFYHIPSIQQNNFGENSEKGFTVLYSDGSHSLVKSTFKEFIKVSINLDEAKPDQIDKLKRQFKGNDNNIRFEFTGSEQALKSLKKEDFTALGIDVKTKNKEIQDDIEYSEGAEIVEHTSSSIKEEFRKFCEKEGLSVEQGLIYLNKKV